MNKIIIFLAITFAFVHFSLMGTVPNENTGTVPDTKTGTVPGANLGTDPTRPADAMADALKAKIAGAEGMKLVALVVGVGGDCPHGIGGDSPREAKDGVALVGESAAKAVAVRRGSAIQKTIDGIRVEVAIRKVSPLGVELEVSGDGKSVFLPGSFTPLAAPTNAPAEFLSYLESDAVPVGRLVRLIADQTGVNISASDDAAVKPVSIFLRNVTAVAAVEEICRTTGLWFRREPNSNVIRITTMEEYAKNLNTFREEATETFTLLYPNVTEVAGVIYGLYPDRTLLSLGEEELQRDDEYDLSRRFRRLRVIEENGDSQFMEMQAPRASTGTTSGGGQFSFSRGSAISHLSQWDQLQRRNRDRVKNIQVSADEAKAIDLNAAENGEDAQNPVEKANIFVSVSRRNNKLIVRTSDMRVMDEIRKLVKEMDVPTPMVLMEVKVLELTLDDDFTARFDWTVKGSGDTLLERNSTWLGNIAQNAISGFEPTFAFQTVSKHVAQQIQLYAQYGKVKTLATPTLLVANNEVSRIFSGEERPIVTGWTAGSTYTSAIGGTTTVPTVPTFETKDIGNMLLITPNINADKTVTLRLLQENSEIAGKADIEVYATDVDGNATTDASAKRQIDYVSSRSITGTFVAKDGLTIMAGGLITETESEQYYRTPFLGSIPLLGWLFRGTEKVKQRSELIVLITPHVITTPIEGGKISEDLLKQLSDHPAAQNGTSNMGVFL